VDSRTKNGRRIFNREGEKVKVKEGKKQGKLSIVSLVRLLRLRGLFLEFFMYPQLHS
jgi:hypothetical protein